MTSSGCKTFSSYNNSILEPYNSVFNRSVPPEGLLRLDTRLFLRAAVELTQLVFRQLDSEFLLLYELSAGCRF